MRMLPDPRALLLALALGASSAGLVACGESENPSLIAPSRADQLTEALDDVEATVEAGNCDATEEALGKLEQRVSELPARTDDRLVSRLEEGAQNLRERATAECLENETETVPTETTPTVTETVPTTTETVPTETVPTETTPTTTTPTETTPPPEQPPPDDGGDDGGAQFPGEDE
jgi:hypothetical protein